MLFASFVIDFNNETDQRSSISAVKDLFFAIITVYHLNKLICFSLPSHHSVLYIQMSDSENQKGD